MTKHAALGILGAALALFTPALASADAIEMPMSCPLSSAPAFCHGPATCAPRGCVAASDCNAGEVCAAQSLCTETHTCFGNPSTLMNHVFGACAGNGCPSGGVCGSFFVCTAGTTLPDAGHGDAGTGSEHTTYCGCRAGERGGSSFAGVLMIAALGLLAARRR